MSNKKTWCGRCGRSGMRRRTMKSKTGDFIYAVYSCKYDDCDRAEGVILSVHGVSDAPELSIYRNGPLGAIIPMSKKDIAKDLIEVGE